MRSLAQANRRASNTRNSNEHPAPTPLHAQNLSTRIDTLTTKSARADRASGARIALFAVATRSTHARTTCEAARRCPNHQPPSYRHRSGEPTEPTHPDEYPAHWAWRRYNEQAAVATLLHAGYPCDFSSHSIVSRRGDLVARGVLGRLPLVAGAIESSLWLRKR